MLPLKLFLRALEGLEGPFFSNFRRSAAASPSGCLIIDAELFSIGEDVVFSGAVNNSSRKSRCWVPVLFIDRVTVKGDNFIQRNDSTETDESPFGSGLTTPVDEDILQPFDQIARLFADIDTTSIHGTPRPKTYNEFKDGTPATPKPRTLSKAVMKAKQFAQGLIQSKKVSLSWEFVLQQLNKSICQLTNAGPLVLPTQSISLKETFPNLKPESPSIEAAPMPLVREQATVSFLLNVPQH